MTELNLYKWIEIHEPGKEWIGDRLMLYLEHDTVVKFTEFISDYLSKRHLLVELLQDGVIKVDIVAMCGYYNINPENIVRKSNK